MTDQNELRIKALRLILQRDFQKECLLRLAVVGTLFFVAGYMAAGL
jgi:hypothetical protein